MDRYWDHGIPNLCLLPCPILEEAVTSTIGDDRYTDPHVAPRRTIYLLKEKWKRRVARIRRRAKRSL